MTTEEFEAVLVAHRAWLTGAADGARANLTRVNLSGADLSGADLSGADLSGADLSDANLSDANLSGANLSRANLSDANLSGAYLSDANLSDANLSDANLSRAYLSGTCLDPALTTHARAFCRACPVDADGYRVVYRTATSQHVGSASYEPGQTYTAPNLSWDAATACHPGIYAGSLDVIRQMFPNIPLIRCRVLDGDWVITAKGCIRCAQLEVLSAVPVGPDGKGS